MGRSCGGILKGHPTTSRAHDTDDPNNPRRHVAVLHLRSVQSARDAVRATIVQEFKVLAHQKKVKKVGRPKLPKGEAKGRIVPVRFTADDLKAMALAAKASDQTLSEWIRSTIHAELSP